MTKELLIKRSDCHGCLVSFVVQGALKCIVMRDLWPSLNNQIIV